MKRIFLIISGMLLSFVTGYYLFSSIPSETDKIGIQFENGNEYSVKITNFDYLSVKLKSVNFWEYGNVWSFEKSSYVTVHKLRLFLTNKEQKYSKVKTYFSKWITINSFDQSYDPKSQTMTFIVQARNPIDSEVNEKRFAASILMAVFESTSVNEYRTNNEREKKLNEYLSDFIAQPDSNNFIEIKRK